MLQGSVESLNFAILTRSSQSRYKNGDYGWGQSIGRIPLPDRTIYTLYDYRKRIATYRTDLDLLLSHQTFPCTYISELLLFTLPLSSNANSEICVGIPVWDDHEVADNTVRYPFGASTSLFVAFPVSSDTLQGHLLPRRISHLKSRPGIEQC